MAFTDLKVMLQPFAESAVRASSDSFVLFHFVSVPDKICVITGAILQHFLEVCKRIVGPDIAVHNIIVVIFDKLVDYRRSYRHSRSGKGSPPRLYRAASFQEVS